MKIAVIGMGKIGLPLAVQYARKGHEVIGVDINQNTIDMINSGKEPFPEEINLAEYLNEVVLAGKLKATASYETAVTTADVVVVVVPLFVNISSEPDFASMDSATKLIGKYLKKGALVCYETTLPIGTTRTRFIPSLEQDSNLTAGLDFSVVFSPERVYTGRIFADLAKYPKIVGGYTASCAKRGEEFYNSVIDFDSRSDLIKPNGVWLMTNCEEAEFVKLAETTYRDVNIALVNQFAKFAGENKMNIYNVIEAANSQPYSHLHKPGISVGGHCIPIYPQFYLWNDPDASIVRSARETNQGMPEYCIKLLKSALGSLDQKKVLILGLSYRPNVKELAFSGALDLVKLLNEGNSFPQILDPYYSDNEIIELGLVPFSSDAGSIDAIIIHTDHAYFTEELQTQFASVKIIIDGRNLLRGDTSNQSLEIHTLGIGH